MHHQINTNVIICIICCGCKVQFSYYSRAVMICANALFMSVILTFQKKAHLEHIYTTQTAKHGNPSTKESRVNILLPVSFGGSGKF